MALYHAVGFDAFVFHLGMVLIHLGNTLLVFAATCRRFPPIVASDLELTSTDRLACLANSFTPSAPCRRSQLRWLRLPRQGGLWLRRFASQAFIHSLCALRTRRSLAKITADPERQKSCEQVFSQHPRLHSI